MAALDCMQQSVLQVYMPKAAPQWTALNSRLLLALILIACLGLCTWGNVVVASPAGCLIQVPQYLLEAATEAGQGAQCNIICTQPRRIAAISVAERVASERGDSPPGTPG